jgi:hypothetical protein
MDASAALASSSIAKALEPSMSFRPVKSVTQAWHGPIVMNTQAEIRQAMSDLRNGSFVR